jgi:hypothetical protein
LRFRKRSSAFQRALSEIDPLSALTAGVRTIEVAGKDLLDLPALRTGATQRFQTLYIGESRTLLGSGCHLAFSFISIR